MLLSPMSYSYSRCILKRCGLLVEMRTYLIAYQIRTLCADIRVLPLENSLVFCIVGRLIGIAQDELMFCACTTARMPVFAVAELSS